MQHSISTITLIPMVTLYLWYKNFLDLFFEILKFIYCKLKTHLLREQYNQNEINLTSIVFITRFKVNKIIKCSKFSSYITIAIYLYKILHIFNDHNILNINMVHKASLYSCLKVQ